MLKLARTLSIALHPLFISFCNSLFFLLLTDIKGAALGFDITLFFLAGILIPLFYTLLSVYNDHKTFHVSQLSEMSMDTRKKLLAYTIVYNVVFLLFFINLNDAFFGSHKPLFASIFMGFVFSMMMSFVLHLLNIKNSLHALSLAFFLTFCLIFSWKIPGIESLENTRTGAFLIFGGVNFIALLAVIWARVYVKSHTYREIMFGIFIGILSPVLLTLLTYGI